MAANYYDVLNVPKDADNKAISDAYKKMALKWHPDKNPDNFEEANRQFQQISEAYQVLSDSTKRLRYDRGETTNNRRFYDYDDDDDDEYDDGFGAFFSFVSPEMLFRHFFEHSEHARFFRSSDFFFDQHHHQPNHRRDRNGKAGKTEVRPNEKRSVNRFEQMCQTRTVNGKKWMTKTYYEDGNKVVARYEDGVLISKHINDVPQKIEK